MNLEIYQGFFDPLGKVNTMKTLNLGYTEFTEEVLIEWILIASGVGI